ncbi:MAG: hypothetical protein IKN27_04885 [Selenomonadaceae bacterium]|nr:hypothetical protein [Selenomonadaceae bacterium]
MPEPIKAITLFKRTSYRNLFPQIPALAEADYFLQFNGYEVFLPQRNQTQETLNIFERSVLKFKGIGNFSVEELSDKLCLQSDFIKFIVTRLTELELLGTNEQITEKGREVLGEKVAAQTENIVPYLLLVTRDTGEIFPKFFSRENQTAGELEKLLVKLHIGSTGKRQIVKGRCVFVKEQVRRAQILPQKNIHNALQKFNRTTDDKIFVESDAHIQASYVQPIYLHVKAVLQDGNVDYAIVSDGQSSHSEFLRQCLERQNSRVLLSLKESATRISESTQVAASDMGKYFEIRKLMRWEDVQATNVDEQEQATERQKRQLENLPKALEWALQYHLLKFPPPQALIKMLACQTPEENFQTLNGFAAQLGLRDAQKFPNFFSGISGGLVKNCMTTKNPTLVPLLAVNIATAVRVADSNFLNAFKSLPEDDEFGFLQRLDFYGKKLRHENKWIPQKNDTPANLRGNILKFIEALLPDYDNPQAVAADLTNASQQKLNAEIAVIQLLGEETFLNLPRDVQKLTLKISPDKIGSRLPLHLEFVTALSMILENLLLDKLRQYPDEISQTKAEIIVRLERAGSTTDLATVSEQFYSRACKQEMATLGAYVLAYMATLTDAQFDKFVKNNLPELCAKVANYRGHANNISLVLDEQELFNLRNDVFNAIKFLEEDKIDASEN